MSYIDDLRRGIYAGANSAAGGIGVPIMGALSAKDQLMGPLATGNTFRDRLNLARTAYQQTTQPAYQDINQLKQDYPTASRAIELAGLASGIGGLATAGMMGARLASRGAAKVAPKIASKMLGQRGSLNLGDLPMDEASRLARAKQMGFTKSVYHGTDWPSIEQFDPNKIKRAKFGEGVYVGDTPNEAQRWGHYVMDLKANIKNPFKSSDPIPDDFIKSLTPREQNKIMKNVKMYGNTFDDIAEEGAVDTKKFTKYLQGKGYDSVKFQSGGFGEGKSPEYSYSIFNPNQLRSSKAKFDPSKSGSSNLLASIAAGIASPAIAYQTYQGMNNGSRNGSI